MRRSRSGSYQACLLESRGGYWEFLNAIYLQEWKSFISRLYGETDGGEPVSPTALLAWRAGLEEECKEFGEPAA